MLERQSSSVPELPPVRSVLVVLLVFVVLGFSLYSNSRNHEFALDDDHSIVRNPYLRSLSEIPSYFTDAQTFSVLQTNVDYRPVLQASYALNHRFSGYEMPGWHWTQVGIHVLCAWLLFLFSVQLLGLVGTESRRGLVVSFLGALVFLVHPVNSGVVNYISGRSSALTALFILAALILELKQWRALAFVMMLLALFTKVEAVAALAVFWALSVLRCQAPWPRRLLGVPKEWLTYLGAVVIYWVARQFAMQGIDFAGYAGASGVTRWMYLCTQTTAWWGYIDNWIRPLSLVADNASYPIFSSPVDPAVALALIGWGVVVLLLCIATKKKPHYPLLSFSALALLSPTSTVVPLAEMMNEHRPYLPIALVGLIFTQMLFGLYDRLPKSGRWILMGLVLAWIGTLSNLTWQRNRVFDNASTYWADVLEKVPSSRAYNNFGLTLMKTGRMEEARQNFQRAIELSPNYSIAHINLAIVLHSLGRNEESLRHYNDAVTYDRGVGNAQIWRGRYFLKTKDYQKALADFEAASAVTNDHYSVQAGLAQAYAGLGETDRSADAALKAGETDFPQFGQEIVTIVDPYFQDSSRSADGLKFFDRLAERWPNVRWIHLNRATLLDRLGRTEEAAKAKETAEKI